MTDRPDPTDPLYFMRRMWELVHALDVRSKWMAQTLGVTSPQRLVIRLVGKTPRITASEIAEQLGKHPSTLTGVLARLQKRGLITREHDAEDRRRARFVLTAKGKRIDRERRGTVEAAVRSTLGKTTRGAAASTLEVIDRLVAELGRE